MKKKVIAIVLAIALVAALCVGFAACNKKANNNNSGNDELVIPSDFKIGLITLHDESSTYDKNFIDAMRAVQQELGLSNRQVLIESGVPEGNECYQKACELAEAGCKVIIADSFGHEQYMIRAAKQYPNVQFCHATGTKAHTENLNNYANAFATIYEGRYLAGVAAGLKLQAMGKTNAPKVGYIGAFTYAEVMSGYSSFFLGVRSIVPSATMVVTFTGSWYDLDAEYDAANHLIVDEHCDLISQHADSLGAPNACEEHHVPNVSYNGSTVANCPNTFIVSSRIDWAPYYKYVITQVVKGQAVAKDWNGTLQNGGVKLTALGTNAPAANTQATLDSVKAQLEAGTLKVFDTSKFTVNGQNLTTYLADVDDAGDFVHETEAISNGYFHESEYRSAPYFDVEIDGITLLDRNYGD
ncbi:MAG: BMP family ABC transporter substrate-binding protein [Clostridia bacterium]|nr:BMP family ABC transporter substrate-binding protein [Clostridia bacterium]